MMIFVENYNLYMWKIYPIPSKELYLKQAPLDRSTLPLVLAGMEMNAINVQNLLWGTPNSEMVLKIKLSLKIDALRKSNIREFRSILRKTELFPLWLGCESRIILQVRL